MTTDYTVTATLDGESHTVHLAADNDLTATFDAIDTVLNLAMTTPLWADGRIELRAPDGTLMRSMERHA